MSESDIAKIFDSIPQNETYSKYNMTLEKIFKTQSLRHFIELYKQKKTISHEKNDTNEFTTNVFGEDLLYKKMKEEDENDIFDDVNNEKEKEKSEKKNEDNNQELWKKLAELKKNKIKHNLDPFKYHPNYNSIYKNIPSVKITNPTRVIKTEPNVKNKIKNKIKKIENKKLSKLLLTEINNIFNENNKQPRDRNNNTLENINITDKNINRNFKLPKLSGTPKSKNITLFIPDRNNHAIRFSKYLPRDFKIPENNKNISYINPFNYIKPRNKNKSIDFDKMLHRNEKTLIYASSLKVPSFGQYNPKYKWIDKDKNIISFNPDEKDEKRHKKYLIKKICTSYNVNSEYQIVDNTKLK